MCPGGSPDSNVSRPPLLLSIVIPTLDEASSVEGLLADLGALTVPSEVIVADGGSSDDTVERCRSAGAVVVRAAPGRGTQLAAGARVARAPLLFFVHADVRLARKARETLEEIAVARPPCAMAFRLRIDGEGLRYRLIEAGVNLRSRLCHLPYGDQGLLVRRRDYLRAGGYPSIAVFEDVTLIRSLRHVTRIHLLEAALDVSARRWREDGLVRRTARNWILLARFLSGASPDTLAQHYPPRKVSSG